MPPTNPLIVSATSTTTGTPDDVPNTLVQRDASGNFAATTITADLVGAASLNVLKTGDTMTGDLTLAGMTTDLNVEGIATLRELITTGHAAINGTISFANNIPGIAQKCFNRNPRYHTRTERV